MGSNTSSSRMDDSDRSRSDDGSDQETDLATILQYLIRSGQVQIISPAYEDEVYIGSRIPPKIRHKPNTTILDKSEFAANTKVASGLGIAKKKQSKNISALLHNRERGLFPYDNFSRIDRCKIGNRYLPNQVKIIAKFGGKAFCGIYSQDGNYFVSASQDRQIRVYETNNGYFKLINSIQARDVGWSVIDVALTPDNNHLVYSSWSSSLHLCPLTGSFENQETLSLAPQERRFCIFSVIFSSDGKHIFGGGNDGYLYIYDRERNQQSLKINAHEFDVNTVAFADQTSQILYSGGDDGLVKVWDRRTLTENNPRPVGVLAGHMDGITYIDSRGDGRHLISNCKDQCIKLWDVRVFSGAAAQSNTRKAVQDQTWDYRWQVVPRRMYTGRQQIDGDTSVMTYRGHAVLKTLIRSRFSPSFTTGQRYIYTGCGVGRVVIYDTLTGRIKRYLNGHQACVRDVHWHPYRQELISSSWDSLLGQWRYSSVNNLETKDEDTDESLFHSDGSRRHTPLRRSRRLAQKKEREKQMQMQSPAGDSSS